MWVGIGSEQALTALLRSDAPQAFLHALSNLTATDPSFLRTALSRAFRALTVSVSDVVGPSQWGLRPQSSTMRAQAKGTLEYLFDTESLDVFLPLLIGSSPQTSTSIAQLLGNAVRSHEHRMAVAEWLPPAERVKQAKTRRGWENTSAVGLAAPSRMGGWVARNLSGLLTSRDVKVRIKLCFYLTTGFNVHPSCMKPHCWPLVHFRRITPLLRRFSPSPHPIEAVSLPPAYETLPLTSL